MPWLLVILGRSWSYQAADYDDVIQGRSRSYQAADHDDVILGRSWSYRAADHDEDEDHNLFPPCEMISCCCC
jgi:hypothetical protein